MTQEIKEEALERLEFEIMSGFQTEEEIFDSITDMFSDEDGFDETWLMEEIKKKFHLHQQASLQWKRPTDFDKLAMAFDELTAERIVCLHNAGYTRQEGEESCMETIEELQELGIIAAGFCYYHEQDLARAVDPEVKNLLLGFDSRTQDDDEALEVARRIVQALKKNGLEVSWPGTVEQRILIENINWQKVPDNEQWDGERVIQILESLQSRKKPFWKFW